MASLKDADRRKHEHSEVVHRNSGPARADERCVHVGAAKFAERAGEDRGEQGRRHGGREALYRLQIRPLAKISLFLAGQRAASGQSITTETSEPYPHHHSLFFGCDRVNGGNYWQDTNERGQILSQGPKIVESSGGKVVLADECLWQQPGKEPIIRDRRNIVIVAPEQGPAADRLPDHPGAADRHPDSQYEPLAVLRPRRAGTGCHRRRHADQRRRQHRARKARSMSPRPGAITSAPATASRKASRSSSVPTIAGIRPSGSPATTASSRQRR